MDTVKDLSRFDRSLVCVPKFCRMSRKADVPISEVSGTIQETGSVPSDLQSRLFAGRCFSQIRRIQAFMVRLSGIACI